MLGAYPFLTALTRILKNALHTVALWLQVDDTSTRCFIFALANAVPVFTEMKKMEYKGVVLNAAWMVPVSAVFGDFLAYAANVAPEYMPAMIAGKLAAGVLALLTACYAVRKK